VSRTATIHADYPYVANDKRHVEIGKPHRGEETKHVYVSVQQYDGDHYGQHAVAHLSFNRARELAHALLAEIGESVGTTVVHNHASGDLPEVGDLPLDYAQSVVEHVASFSARLARF
jgi:hypothetical protein